MNPSQGDIVDVKCRSLDTTKNQVWWHMCLCKDGTVIRMEPLQPNQDDVVFKLKHVNMTDTGNYSCVSSQSKPKHDKIFCPAKNFIFITVGNVDKFWQILKVIPQVFYMYYLFIFL